MSPWNKSLCCLAAFVCGVAISPLARAEVKPNPYLSIVERNPFALKDPPPPPPPKSEEPIAPPAKVILTGLTSLFGPTSKRAFLEITEQEAGKQGTVKRPILREGEREGSVEVVSIDLEKNLVHIRNGGQELDLKFEDPSKLAGAAKPAVAPAPYNPPPQPMSAPTIISPASAENSTRGSSVSTFGGQEMTASPPVQNNTTLASAVGGGMIPPRPLRGAQEGIDPAVQYLGMLANEQGSGNKKGAPSPPVPPIPDKSIYQGRDIPVPPSPGGSAPVPPVPGRR